MTVKLKQNCHEGGRDSARSCRLTNRASNSLRLFTTSVIVLWSSSFLCVNCQGQATSIAELQQHREEWSKYAEDAKRLQILGRFQGRTADTLKLEKFELPCRLSSTVRMPDRMRAGQRLDLSGKLVADNGRLSFLVSRMLVRETDVEQITKRANLLPPDQPDALLALADEFQSDAEFYDDKDLKAELQSLRTRGIALKRSRIRLETPQLRALREQGVTLQVDAGLLNLLQFEILNSAWREPKPDLDALLVEIRKTSDGWDRQIPELPERLIGAFQKDAVVAYEKSSDDDRRWLHRLMFMKVRLQQIESMLKPDGSNGLALAAMVRAEFPGETNAASSLEEHEVSFRLARVDQLSRQELHELTELLTRLTRSDQLPVVIRQWLVAQETKFGRETLVGLLRTADEYLFAAESWKNAAHQEQAVELLKQAWLLASSASQDDARQIADRLRRFGWERLNDQWLTQQQMQALPKDDVQLAVREGRVVRGMTVEQVVKTLGKPARISRLGSSRVMQELWIYDAEGDSGLVIRFRRNLVNSREAQTVEDVSRIRAAR